MVDMDIMDMHIMDMVNREPFKTWTTKMNVLVCSMLIPFLIN